MAIWKQTLLSLLVVAVIGIAWYFYFPGAQEVAARFGLGTAATEGADAAGGGRPAGPGGPGFGGFGGARATQVVVQPADSQIINDELTALGSAAALHSVTVTPQASGMLTEVLVSSGASVEAGDVIARLDAQSQQIAFDRAQLALSDAETTLKRIRQLRAANTVSESQVQTAELAVSNAELGLRGAELDLRNRSITAPIAGRVGLVEVNAGNMVTTQTEIATIEDRSALLVSFWVPERLMGALKPGDPVKAVPVALPQAEITGLVSAIDNRIDTASGTFEVQAEVPNPDDSLRAGMSFTVSMRFAGDSFVAVDPLAIQWGSDGAYLWRAIDGNAVRTPVRIVQRNTESVLVAGELAVGDAIITEGLEALRDGQDVAIAGEAAPEDVQTTSGARQGTAGPRPATGS